MCIYSSPCLSCLCLSLSRFPCFRPRRTAQNICSDFFLKKAYMQIDVAYFKKVGAAGGVCDGEKAKDRSPSFTPFAYSCQLSAPLPEASCSSLNLSTPLCIYLTGVESLLLNMPSLAAQLVRMSSLPPSLVERWPRGQQCECSLKTIP